MKKKLLNKLICLLVIVSIFFQPNIMTAQAQGGLNPGAYTSATVLDGTIEGIPECLDYCIIGICIMLVCTIYGCTVEYVPWIQHNLPDLVVSPYPDPGKISWLEARGAYGAAAYAGGAGLMSLLGAPWFGGGAEDTKQPQRVVNDQDPERDPDLIFKDVAVIGNPYVDRIITNVVAQGIEYICPNNTIGFFPYMLTELDALTWRTNIPELLYPATWIPWARVIGEFYPPQYWAKVHPRSGFVIQASDAKAGAVMSQRAVDVVTRSNQPHVYTRVSGIEPSDEQEERWQMISPELTAECIAFGKDIDYGIGEKNATDGQYGYLYWGAHECCASNRGIPIGYIPTTPICLF